MGLLNIGEHASALLTFFERLNGNSTEILLMFMVFGAILMGLVLITYGMLDTTTMRLMQCTVGTISGVILASTIPILSTRGWHTVRKRIEKFNRRKLAKERLSRQKKEPKLWWG